MFVSNNADAFTIRRNADIVGGLVLDICLFDKELVAVEKAIHSQQLWKETYFQVSGKAFPKASLVNVLYNDESILCTELVACASLTGVFFNQGIHLSHLRI